MRLGTTRLLTLTGAGGVGKTRLALEVAASVADFVDGVWLVDLAAVRDPSSVANATATALGVPNLGTRPVIDQLAAFLAHRGPLIVLDNCEHLVDACAELAQALLSATSGLRMVTTSRRALGLFGEQVFAVPPLAPDDAVELLRDRAIAVRPEFQVTDGNRRQVLRLCDDLDRLPLAIELTASRLRTLTVDEAVNRLEDRFGLLTSGNRLARPHQRTLRALIDWSHELCTPAERLLWNRLSVFVGDFGLDAAEGVCAGDGIGRDEVLDLLDRLVVQSVVLPTEREGLPRYRLLETIRQYGRERLAECGEEEWMLRRHHDFYLALAERIADDGYGPGHRQTLTRLRAEYANLRAALDHEDGPQTSLTPATPPRFHYGEGGRPGEERRRPEAPLASATEPTPGRATGLWVAAWVAVLQGEHTIAYRWLDEAAKLGELLGDKVVGARDRSLRGMLALFGGRPHGGRVPAGGSGGRPLGDWREVRVGLRADSDGSRSVPSRGSALHRNLQAGGRPRRGAWRAVAPRARAVDARLRRLEARRADRGHGHDPGRAGERVGLRRLRQGGADAGASRLGHRRGQRPPAGGAAAECGARPVAGRRHLHRDVRSAHGGAAHPV